jgi:hypothetical protein
MADLLGVDLLSNPSMMGDAPKLDIKMADLENIEIPTLDAAPSAPSAPKLAPSAGDVGALNFSGLDNLNAEPYLGSATPKRMSEETVLKEK